MSDQVQLLESSHAQSAPAPTDGPVHQIASGCDSFTPQNPLQHTQPRHQQPLTPEIDPVSSAPPDALPITQAPTTPSNNLSPQQHAALLLLLSGKPDAAVAASLNLHRTTITRWRLHTPAFREELRQRREELYQSAADRLRTLLVKSLMHFHKELQHRNHDHRHEAALQILRLVNTRKLADPASPATNDSTPEPPDSAKRFVDQRRPLVITSR